MAINYTSLLALIQPVDGTEVSVWGDDVNNGVSSILDVAVAGTQNITTDGNVTLTITQATSSGTNLSSTSAQYAILLLSGARTATRAITLPASSKTYTVVNSTTGGYAQTVGGLTIAVGEVAKIVYNISTSAWMKASTYGGSPTFGTVTANNFIATASITGATNQAPYSYGTLSFTDVNIFASMQSSVNNYNQFAIQNTSNGTAASAGYVAYNDGGTATTNFMTVGINSSGYSGTGSIGAAGYGYLLSASTDMVIGTIGSNAIHFTTNSSATDALAISSAGAVSLPGGTANGVAYLNGSKVLTTGSGFAYSASTSQNTLYVEGVNSTLVLNAIGSVYPGLFLKTSGTYQGGVTNNGNYLQLDGVNGNIYSVNSTEQMRLTSTGLGIGTSSPAGKLQVAADNPAVYITDNNIAGSDSATLYLGLSTVPTYAGLIADFSNDRLNIRHNSATRATFDSSGNLGLGVTPSAWVSGSKAFQIGTYSAIEDGAGGGGGPGIYGNAYEYSTGAYKYLQNYYATLYRSNYSGQHQWFTAPSGTAGNAISFTQAMTLDNSGNLGIGTSSPVAKLSVNGALDGTFNSNVLISGSSTIKIAFNPFGGLSSGVGGLNDGSLVFYGNGANTERARIDSSGNLLWGTTAAGGNNTTGAALIYNSGSSYASWGHITGTGSGTGYHQFLYNGGVIGSITQSGTTAVLYNVTSDQRLKENIVDAPEFGSVIDAIQVRSYDWKADHTHQRAGFIAQELVTVAPEAVHQPTDPEEMMAVDYSKLVPMLVKEIQSLRSRVAELEVKA